MSQPLSTLNSPSLERLNDSEPHEFKIPVKLINEGSDLPKFLVSQAHHDIVAFLALLNRSMFPVKSRPAVKTFELDRKRSSYTETVSQLKSLLSILDSIITEAPPDPGPRRFGNKSFRTWFELVEARSEGLLRAHLPARVVSFKHTEGVDSTAELKAYFLGGFGSPQRLDYGTGHELSFIAFLAGVWKLGGFAEANAIEIRREIVLGVVQPYLALIRKLILTYNLEPAGTHGVWGLDDHSFVPYILGSAQYGPAIDETDPTPTEGSLPDAPDPGEVVKKNKVQSLRETNLYYEAIGFIYDVKSGPFWEHSPTLYDISGVKAGWAKINKGMIKMYNAEVLSKFPVVQHFPFGSLFRWERDPHAAEIAPDVHTKSQPSQHNVDSTEQKVPGPIDVTSTMQGAQAGLTRAPWAQQARSGGPSNRTTTTAPRMSSSQSSNPGGAMPATQASWARQPAAASRIGNAPASSTRLQTAFEDQSEGTVPTKAPWAK